MNNQSIELIFATSNPNKLKELQQMLVNLDIKLLSLQDINWHTEIEETGTTLEENSAIKARIIHQATGKNVFAEDTGLEVHSLNMAPGVYTARYAGDQCNDSDNMNKLLQALQGNTDRRSQFRTVITLIWGNKEYQFEGICTGQITMNIRGNGGFGYDPVFQPDGYESTFAEVGHQIKNSISHRFRALEKMVDAFKNNLV